MPLPPAHKASAGDDIVWSKPTYDRLRDELRRSRDHLIRASGAGASAGNVLVNLHNTDPTALERFSIVSLGPAVILPTDNAAEFDEFDLFALGGDPASAAQNVIVQEPIPAGGIGFALLVGVSRCQIDVLDATHAFAWVVDGDRTKLDSSADSGFRILHGGAVGLRDGKVLVSPAVSSAKRPIIYGIAAQNILPGGSGDVNVSQAIDAPGINVGATVVVHLLNLHDNLQVSSGKEVKAELQDRGGSQIWVWDGGICE